MLRAALYAAVCLAAARGAGLPPAVDDAHYPSEERAERAALKVPDVVSVMGGTVVLSAGGERAACKVGDSAFGWVVNHTPTDGTDVIVLEHDADRWGVLVYTSPRGVIREVRKGVGLPSSVKRPLYNLTGWDASYFDNVRTDPDDYIKQLVLDNIPHREPTFEAFARMLTPKRDYGLIAHTHSRTKFSMSLFGHLKAANFTPLYTPEVGRGEPADNGGELLFDPREYLAYWPAPVPHSGDPNTPDTTIPWTDVKVARLGGHLSAVVLGGWHQGDAAGFQMMAVPNITNPLGEVVVRIGAPTAPGRPVTAHRYIAVLGVDKAARATAATELPDGTRFYEALRAHADDIDRVLSPATFRVDLQYGSEGQRLLDMSRSALVDSWSIWEGLTPNYGTGQYWGGGLDGNKDRGALFLETESLEQPLLLWGATEFAAERLAYYLTYYIHDADGRTPGPNAVPGRPGTIDWKSWKTYCPWDGFADGLADYGRLLQLYVDTASAMTLRDGGAWAAKTQPTVELIANYILELRQNASRDGTIPAVARGMLFGPAEHDTCTQPEYYFSINFWFWRGMVVLGRYFRLAQTAPQLAGALKAEAATYKADLDAALDTATVRLPGGQLFIPPYVNVNAPWTPFKTMIQNTDASYSNFRHYSEMLSSQFLNASLVAALSGFRESHTATVSGMNRWTDHLDDMPSIGYALTDILHERLESFWSLLFGHTANYQSRGTFTSSEQLKYEGDADTASIRVSIGELDYASCVPSVSLVTIMLRWAVVLEHPDRDDLYLLRGAPHRWYHAPIAAENAATRFGNVCVSTDGFDADAHAQKFSVGIALNGSGRYNPAAPLVVTLKALDPSAVTCAASATSSSPAVHIVDVDATTGVVHMALADDASGALAFDVAVKFDACV